MAERRAKVAIGGDTRALEAALGKSRNKLKAWALGVKNDVTGALSGAFGGLGSIVGFAGLGSIAVAAKDTLEWQRRLVALQQSTGLSRLEILKMNSAIQETAQATGVQQTELLTGIETFQAITGEAQKFSNKLTDFAKIAKATSAPMLSIATTAAALSQNLGVLPDQFLKSFDVLARQGDVGAVEFKDMSGLVAELTATFRRFQTKGVPAVAEMGAMLQVVRHGAGDASQAATQLESLLAAIPHHWEKIAKFGVNVWADKGKTQLKDVLEIVDEIAKKVPVSKLGKAIGERQEAIIAFETIRQNREELRKLMDTSSMGGTINRKAAIYDADVIARFDKALASLKATATDLMLKALPDLASAFEKVAAALKWMIDHKAEVLTMLIAWKAASAAIALGTMGTAAAGAAAGAGPAVAAGIGGRIALGVGGGAAGFGGMFAAATAALAAGFEAGMLITDATDSSGNSALDRISALDAKNPHSDFSLRRRALEMTGRPYTPEALYSASAPGGMTNREEAWFQTVTHQPGSAARFFPGETGRQKEGESAADYANRQDAEVIFRPLLNALARLTLALNKEPAPVTATIDAEKVSVQVKNSRNRRRSP